MKGVTALFLGIFGTFLFSWTGLTLIPNFQIGHLDPQADEEGTDIYPVPKSGMADRGRKIYAANGCVYCHSQQVRADYAASDIDRKWGTRRSAPRDYIYERPVLLGKMRVGPDLSNIGKRAPAEDQGAASPPPSSPSPAPTTSPGASPAPNAPQPNTATSPAASPTKPVAANSPGANAPQPNASTSSGASPAASAAANAATSPTKPVANSPTVNAPQPSAAGSPPASVATSPGPAPSKAVAANSPAAAAPNSAAAPASAPSPSPSPAANAATRADTTASPGGAPLQYSAAWHHLHLYSPRSVLAGSASNMPAYKFLYEKRRVSGERSADALKLTGADAPSGEWEIVPTYEAKCLVAYLMSLDQSHELQEAKLTSVPASSPAPGSSPAPAKEEKK